MNHARIDALQKVFPECVVEYVDKRGVVRRQVDFVLLKRAVGSCLAESCSEAFDERYEFTWQGKKLAWDAAFSETTKRLSSCKKESVFWDKTQNIYIEGENLDALKLLRREFQNKIKVIYIDPPYNSGCDFVYNDDYRISSREWKESKKKTENETETLALSEQGRLHSLWCSMLYSRTIVARELLSEDGVMLVSVDDRELGNAIKILDEVFGEASHVATFVWETKTSANGIPPASMRVSNHEYVLAYARRTSYRFLGELRGVDEGFSNPDGDPRGPWKRQYLQRFGQGFPMRTVVDPDTGVSYTFETPYTEEKMAQLVREQRVIFPKGTNRYPARKEFFHEYANPKKPILTSLGLHSTKVGSEELKKLFGGVKVFDYPKPLSLIVDLLRKTLGKDGVALDFFSGSGTTAHATMSLNAEDGGTRRFICIQRPERCDKSSVACKAGFSTVSEVGKERLRLAGKAILERKTDAGQAPDVGFRVYKIAERSRKSSR